MVVLSQPNLPTFWPHKSSPAIFSQIPVVDLSDTANAAPVIAAAFRDFGFFKAINHGVPAALLANLEDAAAKFFKRPQEDKNKSYLPKPNPFGYGNKIIGSNGDVGWVEYLLFCCNPDLIDHNSDIIIPSIPDHLRALVNEYVQTVKNMACSVLEMVADELGIKERDAFSRLVMDDKSDSCFRLNHYPPCPDFPSLNGTNLIGFGEHTDPQLVSVLRSNSVSGLQIKLMDGSWVSVPPDSSSFFFNVGDSLQVLTNGRFRSVKHRVYAGGLKSRLSMIYFAGPPLTEKIKPIDSLMEEGEESLYKEFTWSEYKKSAYKSRLGDDRLVLFEKTV